MKKNHLLFLLLSLLSFNIYAQSFDDGTNLVFLGFGIPPAQKITRSYNNIDKTSYLDYKLNNYGTFIGKYEHGLHKNFGLGLNLEYSAASVSYKYTQVLIDFQRKININVLGAFIRFNGHLPIIEKLDIYAGFGLGYFYTIEKTKEVSANNSITTDKRDKILEFDYQASIGVRYMIKDKIGLFAEFGRASTIAQVGCAIKF